MAEHIGHLSLKLKIEIFFNSSPPVAILNKQTTFQKIKIFENDFQKLIYIHTLELKT